MFQKKILCVLLLVTSALAVSFSGCTSQSKDAVKPEKFAPPPPGDSAADGGAAKAEG